MYAPLFFVDRHINVRGFQYFQPIKYIPGIVVYVVFMSLSLAQFMAAFSHSSGRSDSQDLLRIGCEVVRYILSNKTSFEQKGPSKEILREFSLNYCFDMFCVLLCSWFCSAIITII